MLMALFPSAAVRNVTAFYKTSMPILQVDSILIVLLLHLYNYYPLSTILFLINVQKLMLHLFHKAYNATPAVHNRAAGGV